MKKFQLNSALNDELPGDRIKLPSEILEAIILHKLESPLTFKLSHESKQTHVSVLEFTAPIGQIEINSRTLKNLNICDSALIDVELALLPKCEFIKLVPVTPNSIKDQRATLEAFLRKEYTVLCLNEFLEVPLDNTTVTFKIVDIKPAEACLCLNTDMEVDIVTLTSIDTNNLDSVIKWRQNFEFQSETQDVEYYQIELFNGPLKKYIIDVKLFKGDCVVYVSTNEKPSRGDYIVSGVLVKDSIIHLEIDLQRNDINPFLYIAVEAFESKCKYNLSVKTEEIKDDKENKDGLQCGNCKSIVPAERLQMHMIYCERNNTFCEKCSKIILTKDLQLHWHCENCSSFGDVTQQHKHNQVYHTDVICTCSEVLDFLQVPHHRQIDCEDRLIICRYCHLKMRAGKLSRTAKDLYLSLGLTEHESECGARTTECMKCSKQIQLKDIQTHFKIHQLQNEQKRYPICSNQCCGNIYDEKYGNALKLCGGCFKPFWSPRDDPENAKLIQKLVLAYHMQFTVGCGAECENIYCATFVGNKMDPNESALKAYELVKKCFDEKKFWFCVADKKAKNRRSEALVLSEKTKKRFDACVQALFESGDLSEGALKWLNKNA